MATPSERRREAIGDPTAAKLVRAAAAVVTRRRKAMAGYFYTLIPAADAAIRGRVHHQRDADALADGLSVPEGLRALSKVDELCAEPLVAQDTRKLLEDVLLVIRGRRGHTPPSSCD
jgi:hypothetical protein